METILRACVGNLKEWCHGAEATGIRGGSRIRETGVRQARARVRPALEERTLGGSGCMLPQKYLDFRPSEIVVGAIWGRNTRPPHLLLQVLDVAY